MNLKYYLRGLGIGIVVSTLIVGIAANNQKETLSDEEIKQRAGELGMVEASGVLTDDIPMTVEASPTKTPVSPLENEKEAESSPAAEKAESSPAAEEAESSPAAEEAISSPAKEPEAVPTEKPAAEKEPERTETEEKAADESKEVASEVNEETQKTVTVTVKSGDGSYTVCKKLEAAGLIESATAYDAYLYQNGYDKRIIAASHEIPVGADAEQIAKIITGKN